LRYKAGLVLVLIASAAVIVLINLPPTDTAFRIEKELVTGTTGPVSLTFEDFSNCDISISFSDDMDLLYALDIDLHHPATLGSVIQIVEGQGIISLNAVSGSDSIISQIRLSLYSSIPFNLAINYCVNITADVTYSHGANLSAASFDFYESTGELGFAMVDSVVHSSDDMFYMRVGQGGDTWPEILDIDLKLPSNIYGWIYFQAEENLTARSVEDWIVVEEHDCINLEVYGTGWPPFDPQTKFRVRADFIYFSLDWNQ
jgi:hypothetical protein